MAIDRPSRLLRKPDQPRQSSYLELFFDLAFIVTLTLLTQRLVRDLDWTNVMETLVLLAGGWWVWIATAWSTDWFNPSEPFIQRLVMVVMFLGLLMAASVAEAYGAHGVLFAGAYSAIHLVRGTVLAAALRGHPMQRRTLVVAVWFGLSAIPWLVGAFQPPRVRLWLWIVAIVIDYSIAWFGWPTPKLGRVSNEQLRTIGEHLSERYRQVFIIALGEIILVSGLAYSSFGFDMIRSVAFLLSFINAALLWWIYLEPALSGFGVAIDRSPPRLAVSTAYFHLILIAGTVLTAAGDEILIHEPLGEAQAKLSAVIVGGTALFLAGRNLIDVFIYRRRSWPRLIGMIVTAGISPALLSQPLLVVAACTNAILFVVALSQSISNRSVAINAPVTGP